MSFNVPFAQEIVFIGSVVIILFLMFKLIKELPENLRLGSSIKYFLKPDRIIIGTDQNFPKDIIKPILNKLCPNILWMSELSAEMVKHSINSFLAMSICFTNELASLAETVGANIKDIETGLKLTIDWFIENNSQLKPEIFNV